MRFFGFLTTGTVPVQQREVAQAASVPGVPATTAPEAPSKTETNTVTGGDYQERIAYVGGPNEALLVGAVYRAVNLRADTMSVMPVQYQRRDYEKGNLAPVMRGFGKRLNYLLQEEPNPIMSAADLWKLVEINRLFFGNGFVYIERDEFGFPVHLWLVKSGGYNVAMGVYSSIVYLTDYGYVTKVNVPREDVLHFPNTFRYDNIMWGMSTLMFAVATLNCLKQEASVVHDTFARGSRRNNHG